MMRYNIGMRSLLVVFLLLVVNSNKAQKKEYRGPSEEDVIILDGETWQPSIFDSQEPWFLDFYADWCSHCQDMRADYAKLATKLKGVVKVAKTDVTNEGSPFKVWEFKGYPLIVFMPQGYIDKKTSIIYDGPRTVDMMADWILEKINESKGFVVPRLTSEAIWNEYCVDLKKPICVITFLPHIRDSSASQRAVTLQSIREGITDLRDKPVSLIWAQAGDHPQLQAQFNLGSGFPTVLLISPFRRAYTVMKSSFSPEHLVQFIEAAINPRRGGRTKLGHFSQDLTFNNVPVEQEEAHQGDSLSEPDEL